MATKDKTITKADALEVCEGCTKRDSKTCIYSDIERSRDGTIIIPKCMVSFGHKPVHPRENTRTPTREHPNTHEKPNTQNDSGVWKTQKTEQGNEEIRTPQGYQPKSHKIKLSKNDEKIIVLLGDQENPHHVRSLARALNTAPSTMSNRLKKLEKAGIIKSYKGVAATKIYKLSVHLNTQSDQSLIYDDNRHQSAQSFTAHCMTFKFPIITGTQPKSKHPFKMNNWTGYTFHHKNYEIRSTTQSIVIDINQDLGAGSIDDLTLLYSDIARGHLVEFAKQHNITLGTPQSYRKQHFTIPNTSIGKILSERGSFNTAEGLMIDESKSKGDLEMGEDLARDFEFTLNKLPGIANNIENRLGELNETTKTEFEKTTDRFDKVDEGITNLHILIQMKHENDKLRDDLKETLKLAQDQIKTQNLPEEPHIDKKINKDHSMQIYG